MTNIWLNNSYLTNGKKANQHSVHEQSQVNNVQQPK